ncbi:MAG: NAD(P)/FAD-dependent oxidoreductase [Rhodospirillales bacterium]
MLDCVVIGAGMAGLSATKRLRDAGLSVQCLEARGRIGGRAQSATLANGALIDRGCHWLHSAEMNPLVGVAKALGFAVDKKAMGWTSAWSKKVLGKKRFKDYENFWDSVEEACEGLDQEGSDLPLSEVVDRDSPWYAPWSAAITYIWGASPTEISAFSHAHENDSELDWRMALGMGNLVGRYGAGLPITLEAPVRRIALTKKRVRVESARGVLEARTVVIAVPASLLAAEAIVFEPGLPETKRWALEGLPLGSDNKVHLAISGDTPWPRKEIQATFHHDRERTGHYFFHPFGQPVVEGYFGGALSNELAKAGPAAMADFAVEEICSHYGNAARGCLSFLGATAWDLDPWSLGAYSYVRPGYAKANAVLAEPLDGRLFFAGEASHPEHSSTCHGAYMTGLRAADEVLGAVR